MSELIFNKWLWIFIILMITIGVLPFLIMWLILLLPSPYNIAATFFVVVGWGIAAGYKEWVLFKKEEKKQRT
jgi:predicted membrane channel-forming protein YqfA (hemolysin III family)